MSCLFCKIVNKEIPANIVYENDHCLAFRDIAPQAPTHILVIPKVHVDRHSNIQDPASLTLIHQAVLDIIKQENIQDYRLVINNGSEAGQTVWHLHLHILSGRPLSWPPG
ncbi:MAG: histidine triad nucleotide-binding protein [Deltaproteobacteria bacterium]|nr:MAG: histidine triad nucleotide-binding protein [Deltaproteobacteria bacterium]